MSGYHKQYLIPRIGLKIDSLAIRISVSGAEAHDSVGLIYAGHLSWKWKQYQVSQVHHQYHRQIVCLRRNKKLHENSPCPPWKLLKEEVCEDAQEYTWSLWEVWGEYLVREAVEEITGSG